MIKKIIKTLFIFCAFVLVLNAFTSCMPKNLASAKEKLERKGYAVQSYGLNEKGYVYGEATGTILASKDDESLILTFFKTKKEAKYYFSSQEQGDEKDSGYIIALSGKMVIVATEKGYKDLKN